MACAGASAGAGLLLSASIAGTGDSAARPLHAAPAPRQAGDSGLRRHRRGAGRHVRRVPPAVRHILSALPELDPDDVSDLVLCRVQPRFQHEQRIRRQRRGRSGTFGNGRPSAVSPRLLLAIPGYAWNGRSRRSFRRRVRGRRGFAAVSRCRWKRARGHLE